MVSILPFAMALSFAAMLALERFFPARPQPRVRGWLFKGIVFFVLGGVLGAAIPAGVSALLGPHTAIDLHRLGTFGGGVVAFLVADLVGYVVHRVEHNVPWLWRWTHQLHHSAERLDVAGSSYFHPLDILSFGASTSIAVAILGVTPDAAALGGLLGFLGQTFQHLNVRTPQWLGWIIQRPEAHSLHHARGIHAYNYGSFMLWDIVLGTFRNPRGFSEEHGFWDGASARVGAMLIGRDVTERIGEG
jgi:sterol desaturase/sphingolipid hydroxylase (fatty acid hydroxylase superfamily)